MRSMMGIAAVAVIMMTAAAIGQDSLFAPPVNYAGGSTTTVIRAADLDGDDALDLAIANISYDSVTIVKNNGDGTFQAPVQYSAGDQPRGLFIADLDGDLDNDLAVGNRMNNNVSIFRNNGSDNVYIFENYGDGYFRSPMSMITGDGPYYLAVADLNGDDFVDVVTGDYLADSISVFINIELIISTQELLTLQVPGRPQ